MSFVVLMAAALVADIGEGGPSPADKAKTERIRIEEKLNAQVPLDARFVASDGRTVTLREVLRTDRPALLSIGYYSCPMLCDVVLNGVKRGVKDVPLEPGKDFQVVSISIEPNDGWELAREKKKNYLENLGRKVDPAGWEFLTVASGANAGALPPASSRVDGSTDGVDAEAKRVADALGWNFFWDTGSKQWAHAAGVFVLTPEGKVSRVLYGIEYPASDLKLALVEASQGKVGSAVDRLLLWCYHYDPQGRAYVIYAIRVMRIAGAITVVGIIAMVALLNRRRQGARA